MSDSYTPASSPRLCPDCKVEMEWSITRFPLSENPQSIFANIFFLDIYTCPQCGLVRLYSYDHRRKQEAAAEEAARQPDHTLTLEAEAPRDPWEKKGPFGRKKDKPDWES